MPVPTHHASIPDDTEHPFNTSWHKLVNSGKVIVALCEARQWQKAGQVLQLRKQLSERHFKRFPVGPDTRELYRGGRLATLFAQEHRISDLQAAQPRLRNTSQAFLKLSLVARHTEAPCGPTTYTPYHPA